ncbi:hypothetical protein FDP41_011237 [Naegleria fowleri]|uniref:Uncharacterized protein n=1 Tax=Naegleria fowleri TaxID=5763 RepID=A0A6A5BYD9_NAEFO|nr:uncharacterized protein FDP41_011237 [Naegleria fowleri]KAF0982307.1 hypothetical protein FDP41_011237 [Naegleria fowleri]
MKNLWKRFSLSGGGGAHISSSSSSSSLMNGTTSSSNFHGSGEEKIDDKYGNGSSQQLKHERSSEGSRTISSHNNNSDSVMQLQQSIPKQSVNGVEATRKTTSSLRSSPSTTTNTNLLNQEIQNIIFNTNQSLTNSIVPNVQPEYYLKFIVIGGPNVGKSAIINKYMKNNEHPSLMISPTSNGLYIPTIGVDLYSKPIRKYRNAPLEKQTAIQFPVRLNILDIPHSEHSKKTVSRYFENCHGILIVFDITSAKSVSAIDQWRGKIPVHLIPNTILIAHKAEMKPHIINSNSLDNYVRDAGLLAWFSTSVRNQQSITRPFQYLIDRTLSKMVRKYNGLPTLNHFMNNGATSNKKLQIPISNSTSVNNNNNNSIAITGQAIHHSNTPELSPYSTSAESSNSADSRDFLENQKNFLGERSSCLYDILEEKNPNLTLEAIENFKTEISSFYYQLSNRFLEFKKACQSQHNENDSHLLDMLSNECDAEKIILLNKLQLVEKEVAKIATTENASLLSSLPTKHVTKLYIELKREFYIVKLDKWISFWNSLKTRFCLNYIFFASNSSVSNSNSTNHDTNFVNSGTSGSDLSLPLSQQPTNQAILKKLESRKHKIEKLKHQYRNLIKPNSSLAITMQQPEMELLVENDNTFSVINQNFSIDMISDLYPALSNTTNISKESPNENDISQQ